MCIEKVADKIEQALDLYNEDTYDTVNYSRVGVLEVARKAIEGKKDLISLLSKHPTWNPDNWTVKLKVDRPIEIADCSGLRNIEKLFQRPSDSYPRRYAMNNIAWWFYHARIQGQDWANNASNLPSDFNQFCPHAWHKGRKLTKILSDALKECGLWEDEAGEFQRRFAEACEFLKTKKETVTLIVSVHPAHFLTMSNPKNSESGDMLTSCHSLNNTEYEYNCGCSGYAADYVTMIAFTVSDPDDEDLQYYRKTSRQLFMYKVGTGVLVQSRMYNSEGGTSGLNAWSESYRNAITKLIAECEEKENDWEVNDYYHNKYDFELKPGIGFGGYPDWIYSDFNAVVAVRKDSQLLCGVVMDYRAGKRGTCLGCGCDITEHVFCSECNTITYCEWCEEHHSGETTTVHDRYGDLIEVCDDCLRNDFSRCEECDEWYPTDEMYRNGDGDYLCDDCSVSYERCENCEELYRDLDLVIDSEGNEHRLCTGCVDASEHTWCEHLNRWIHDDLYCRACEDCDGYNCDDCYEKEREE